jgi:uncharacterized membrane protein YraQ (UPF0718 family)
MKLSRKVLTTSTNIVKQFHKPMIILFITFAAGVVSYFFDKKKTVAGIRSGLTMFLHILPGMVVLIWLISILIYLLPQGVIAHYLGKEAGLSAYLLAAIFGAIALMPGFIAYPFAGVLLRNGVSYQVIGMFLSTLLMVGVLSIQLEARYYGWKVAMTRNLVYLVGAIIIGTTIALII